MSPSPRQIIADWIATNMARPDMTHVRTLRDLERVSGVSYSTLQRLKKGEQDTEINKLLALARVFKTHLPGTLRPPTEISLNAPSADTTIRTEEPPKAHGFRALFHTHDTEIAFYDAPIIEWERIGMASEHDGQPPQTAPRISIPGGKEGIVAAYMPDESMQRPDGTGIARGAILVIDLHAPVTLDAIVVARMRDGRCYVRQLVSDAGRRKLMPFNPRYDPAPAPEDRADYIGVVTRSIMEQHW